MQPLENRAVPATFTVMDDQDVGNTDDLRSCIAQANANPGPDIIDFDSGIFASPSTIVLDSQFGSLGIIDDVFIDATSISGVTISGGNAMRVFAIGGGDTVSFSYLTIQDGNTDDGGGIYSPDAHLMLDHCTQHGSASTRLDLRRVSWDDRRPPVICLGSRASGG